MGRAYDGAEDKETVSVPRRRLKATEARPDALQGQPTKKEQELAKESLALKWVETLGDEPKNSGRYFALVMAYDGIEDEETMDETATLMLAEAEPNFKPFLFTLEKRGRDGVKRFHCAVQLNPRWKTKMKSGGLYMFLMENTEYLKPASSKACSGVYEARWPALRAYCTNKHETYLRAAVYRSQQTQREMEAATAKSPRPVVPESTVWATEAAKWPSGQAAAARESLSSLPPSLPLAPLF